MPAGPRRTGFRCGDNDSAAIIHQVADQLDIARGAGDGRGGAGADDDAKDEVSGFQLSRASMYVIGVIRRGTVTRKYSPSNSART